MLSFNFIAVALCFASGCVSLWFFKSLPTIPYALFWSLLSFSFAVLLRRKMHYLALIFVMLTGFLFCYHAAHQVLLDRLPLALEGKVVTVTGTIMAIPEGSEHSLHFEFKLQSINDSAVPWSLPQIIRLAWYQTAPDLKVGETWRFVVKLKPPRSTFNPASFDYEAWLFSHHFAATGYVVDKGGNTLLHESVWKNPMKSWRETIQLELEKALGNNPNLGMVEALSIGARDALSVSEWQIMQATGTNHLIAIAGLHVGFVVAFMYGLIKFFWRRFTWLMLWLPSHEAGIIGALLAAIYYSALSGFALPTMRALIMLSVGLCANLFRRQIPVWQAIAMALLGVLLFDPLSVFAMSFWLSFVAVFVILFCVTGRLRLTGGHFMQSVRIQWVITLGLAPITLYFFHQISLINLVANGIAIPWVGFVSLPLIFLGLLLMPISSNFAGFCFKLAAGSLHFYWPILAYLASLDRLQWQTYVPHVGLLLFALLGCLIFLAPKGFPFRFLGLLGFLPLLFPYQTQIPESQFKLSLLDVGQGLSAMVETTHHILVFDTGAKLDTSYDMGQSVVVPALQFRHLKQVDVMMISHGDNDHSGGAEAILQALPVKFLLTSVPEKYVALPVLLPIHLFEADVKGSKNFWQWLGLNMTYHLQKHWPRPMVMNCVTSQHWRWDGVDFQVLSPDRDYYPKKGNDRSCVLRVFNAAHSLLLTGDIEKPTEVRLITRFNGMLSSDVIVAPHHGSKSSSSLDFVQAVHPSIVLYPTGYHNRFGFPHAEVVARYKALGSIADDTAISGQIQIEFPDVKGPLVLLDTRKINGGFWNY